MSDRSYWDSPIVRRNAMYFLILVCIALFVHEIFGKHGILAMRRGQREVKNLQQQIRQLEQENEQLEKQIKALKSDPKAIERLAREQMRLAKPGEIIYTLPDKDSSKPPATDQKKKTK